MLVKGFRRGTKKDEEEKHSMNRGYKLFRTEQVQLA